MKFKYLIIAFSILIVIIILITSLLPLLLAGPQFAANFRYITLPLMVFMVFLLFVMGIFFLLNYRLLSLLEREDWPALSYYLEQKIFVKGRYSNRFVRLLASSYLVISDFNSVLKLESKAHLIKPSVIEKNILIFGAARVLSGNHAEAASFFKTYMDKAKSNERQWTHWFYGFSQLLCGSFNASEPEFSTLALTSNDALITGLSAYFLQNSVAKYSIKPEHCITVAENGRTRVTNALHGIHKWEKEVDKMSTEIYIAIVRKYIDAAGKWIYHTSLETEPNVYDLEHKEAEHREHEHNDLGHKEAAHKHEEHKHEEHKDHHEND